MIEFTKAYIANGKTYTTLAEAQQAELREVVLGAAPGINDLVADPIASYLVAKADKVLDILTTTGKSRPRARASNGGKKVRKPKGAPVASGPIPIIQAMP